MDHSKDISKKNFKMIKNSRWAIGLFASNPHIRRERQVALYEFEASLVYKESFRTARVVTQKNPVAGGKINE